MRYCSVNFSHKKPTLGLPHFGGVAVLVSAAVVHPPVAGFRVLGIFPALEILEKVKGRGYDLPKRQMSVSVLGLIFGSSQFPNDGKLTFCGMLLFMGRVR